MSKRKFTSSVVPTRPTTQQSSSGLSVIITGSAKPYRMSSFGAKPLLTINNMSLIDYMLPVVSNTFPNAEIILTIGYEADKIIKKISPKIKLVENQLYETTNIAEEVRLAINATTNNKILIIDGDLFFDKTLFNKSKFDHSFIFVDNNQLSDDEVGITASNNIVENFSFGLSPKWSNIIYLLDKELALFRNIINDRKNSNLYLFEVINMIISSGAKIHISNIENSKLRKINSTKELRSENTNNS